MYEDSQGYRDYQAKPPLADCHGLSTYHGSDAQIPPYQLSRMFKATSIRQGDKDGDKIGAGFN
jgi:hypothetical protein